MAKSERNQSDKLDAVYQWLVIELQQARDVLLSELRMSSAQIGALHSELRNESAQNAATVSQEIRYSYRQNQTIYDGLATMMTHEVGERLNALDEKIAAFEQLQTLLNELYEMKQSYVDLQNISVAVHSIVADQVNPKLDVINANQAAFEQLAERLDEINARLEASLADKDEYVELAAAIVEKTEENVAAHSAQIVEAVSAMENVDYERITDEVGDRMLEILNQIQGEAAPVKAQAEIDYDRIVYGAAEKVIESLPAPEKLDYERLANLVASKLAAPEVDYERLADLVVAKMSANMEQTSDVCIDEDGVTAIADKVAEKLGVEEPTYELVIDQDGIDAIAKGVSEEICKACAACDLETVETEEVPVEETVEETVEEVVEETPVEEAVEEVVEEPAPQEEVEEVVEPAPVERPSVEEELAATAAIYEEVGNDLIDAETGLVIRLKRSFTAKMRQSEEKVKGYYSDIKNELVSYKKINSNVSWHGDRFNFGRDTVAKININGKTLCFYLALDPNDPEYKETVYHQKDVSAQKAYESTPFLMKIKSDAAVKKALRLVGYLAEKLGAEKVEGFEAVDYVGEFAYASTKQLFDDGFIKATKEKKVDFDF